MTFDWFAQHSDGNVYERNNVHAYHEGLKVVDKHTHFEDTISKKGKSKPMARIYALLRTLCFIFALPNFVLHERIYACGEYIVREHEWTYHLFDRITTATYQATNSPSGKGSLSLSPVAKDGYIVTLVGEGLRVWDFRVRR